SPSGRRRQRTASSPTTVKWSGDVRSARVSPAPTSCACSASAQDSDTTRTSPAVPDTEKDPPSGTTTETPSASSRTRTDPGAEMLSADTSAITYSASLFTLAKTTTGCAAV